MRAVVIGILLAASTAHADSYFTETHTDLGIETSSMAFGGASATGTGVHFTEHNGLAARMILGVPFMLGILQVGGDQVLNTSVTKGSEDYVVEEKDSHGVVKNREVRTRETSTFNFSVRARTAEEKAAQKYQRDQIAKEYSMFAKLPMHFELAYMPDRDDGHVHGISASLYPLAISITKYVEIAAGISGTHWGIDVIDADGMHEVVHRSRAIPIRLGIAPARWLVVTGELHNNFLSQYGSTIRGTAAISIPRVERFYAKLGYEKIGVGHGAWSSFVEGGVRF